MKKRLENIEGLLSERLTLYPVLTGVLFLVNELRKNAIFFTLEENVFLILIVMAFSLLIDFLSRKFIKNKIKAALIAVLFVFINLFYQDIFLVISAQNILIRFINSTSSNHPEILVIPILLIIWLFFAFIVLRSSRVLKGLNLYLNVLFIALILFEVTKWVIAPVPQIKLAENDPFPVNTDLLQKQKPDIYYIILDAYTSSESLKKYWSFDNSMFEDSLKHLGFYIAHKSKTDYMYTAFCLASYLNSSSLLLDSTKHYTERNLIQLIRKNRLFDWLNANKYKCYNYSIFDSFGSKKYYDPFSYNHFLGRTIWYTNFLKFYHFLNPSSSISQTNLKIFKKLQDLPNESQEKQFFVYAHLMTPHFPFTFDKTGRPYNKSDSLTDEQKYLGQLIFTNSLTLETINHILFSSRNKPIIIIQGDHGYRYINNITKSERSHEAHTLFYAIYTPNALLIPEDINPASTFKKLIKEINGF
jgi:hypothetical protein